RIVTDAKLPPDMSGTSTASGKTLSKSGRNKPFGLVVSKRQAASISGRACAPRAASAPQRLRACQSFRSVTRAMVGPNADARGEINSGERGIEKFQVEMPGVEILTGIERGDGHLPRTKQHRIDRVEVAFEPLEDIRKRLAIVARARARQFLGQRTCIGGGANYHQMNAPGVNNSVVGAPHRSHHVRMWRREGRGRHAFDNAVQRELQFVRLVQRDLEHACYDLGRTGK